MIQLQIASDLHLECHQDEGRNFIASLPVCADTLVLAGDICSCSQIEKTLKLFGEKWKQVIYIAGNHEYYHSSLEEIDDACINFLQPDSNVHWIEKGSHPLNNGTLIHGATLWYDYEPYEAKTIADFSLISNFEPTVYHRHRNTVKYFKSMIRERDVVVTHQTPSYQSMTERFRHFQGNCWFHNNLDSLILEKKPALWIHGHTHQFLDYKIGDTRIVCNPYGYPNEKKSFKEDFVIEL